MPDRPRTNPAVNENLSQAVVLVILWRDKPWPRDDADAVIGECGPDRGPALATEVVELIRESRDLPVDWSNLTWAKGVAHMKSAFAGAPSRTHG